MTILDIQKSTLICKKCFKTYNNKTISIKYIQKNVNNYLLCCYCRKIKNCPICNKKFHHFQNQTCSLQCANKLKEKTYLNSMGTTHNFSKNSKSRLNFEKSLLEEFNTTNVFGRPDVKEKILKTNQLRYNITTNISQSKIIRERINKTLQQKLKNDPTYYKKRYHTIRQNLIKQYGFDPRVTFAYGTSSKESLSVFLVIYDWIIKNNFSTKVNIFFGYKDSYEYSLESNNLKMYLYDFTILNLNLIFEYNNTTWHANPDWTDDKLYAWKNPFKNESAYENIEYFNTKISTATSQGFRLKVLWSTTPLNKNLDFCKKEILKSL